MAGFEELTRGELLTIFYMTFIMVMTFSITMGIIRPLINSSTAKLIRFHIDAEVAKAIGKELDKKPFIQKIVDWWKERKIKKEESLTYR